MGTSKRAFSPIYTLYSDILLKIPNTTEIQTA